MGLEISGEIIEIGEVEHYGEKGFFKRQLVIKTDEKFPQEIPISFNKDKSDLLNDFSVGNSVVVGINLTGSSYNGRRFSNINGWSIDFDGSKPSSVSRSPLPRQEPSADMFEPEPTNSSSMEDDFD